jgi:hypothetical protein
MRISAGTMGNARPKRRSDAANRDRKQRKLVGARYGRGMEATSTTPRREKTLENVGIPRVLFVAGAGFEPATFGL